MDTTTAEPVAQAEEQIQPLTALDRCDACGAQAYVSVTLATGELLFCGHHYTKSEEKLAPILIGMRDERDRLYAVAKLDVSA